MSNKKCWLYVIKPKEYEDFLARNSEQYSFIKRAAKNIHLLSTNDEILIYVSSLKKFVTIVKIDSICQVTPLDQSYNTNGCRNKLLFKLTPVSCVGLKSWLNAREMMPYLRWPAKYPPKGWHLSLQKSLQQIPEGDLELIKAVMKKEFAKSALSQKNVKNATMQ